MAVVFLLPSCSTTDDKDQPAQVYFSTGMEMMEEENYLMASEQFEQLNAIHPFSEYAEQSLLELTYAYYFNEEREQANITINRLIRQYPESEQFDYALYLRGVINFDQDRNVLHNSLGVNVAKRSLKGAQLAFVDFSQLVQRYPGSRFAVDARNYMMYIRDQLALKEILIGEFYLARNASIAALSRAQHVLEQFASSNYTDRALDLMAQAYQQMDMQTEAQQTRARLARYFPDYQTPAH